MVHIYVRTYLWLTISIYTINWFLYVEIEHELQNCSKLQIGGSRVHWQSKTQQLHQITTHKCGCLTISQGILTISLYKIYQEMNHYKLHHVIRVLTAETDYCYCTFPMTTGNIGHFLWEHHYNWLKHILRVLI